MLSNAYLHFCHPPSPKIIKITGLLQQKAILTHAYFGSNATTVPEELTSSLTN
jgi:hypothetical protein